MFLNNDKNINSLDLLYDLSDNDVFGSSNIQTIQNYDKYSSRNVQYTGENRPDLFASMNQYGYLLFANPKGKWEIGSTYNNYIDDVIVKSKMDKILQI